MSQISIAEPAVPESGAPPARRGILALFTGMLVKPRSTLAYLRDAGGQSWIAPALLALAVVLASRLVLVPLERVQAEAALSDLQEQVADQSSGDVVTEGPQISGSVVTGGPIAGPGPLFDYGLPLAGLALSWAARGSLLFLLSWLLGGRASFGAMFRMGVWTTLPDVVRVVVTTLAAVLTGQLPGLGLEPVQSAAPAGAVVIAVGPGGPGFPPITQLFWQQFVSSLDIYTFWGLVLTVIGVAVTARLSWVKAAASTGLYWVLALLAGILPPLVSFGMMSLVGGPTFR